jgi:hypothetical protein
MIGFLLGVLVGIVGTVSAVTWWGVHLARRRRRWTRTKAGTAKVAKLHAAEHTVAVLNAEPRDAGRHTIEGR